MPDFCSCGAELPPDARFCHKCGKPQRAEMLPQPAPDISPVEPVVDAAPRPPALNFHNPVAVRVGLSMASLAAMLSWIPFVNLGFVLWWVAAGFFSVFLYRRRTGQFLTVRSGLRLGWITGILTFVIMTVLFTVSIVPLAVSKGGLGAVLQQQLSASMPPGDPNVQEAMRMFQSPAGLASILLFMLLLFFLLATVLCGVGGAIGAKVASREN